MNCECGNKTKYIISNIKQKIGLQIITIYNMPHYYCDKCCSTSYDINLNISQMLKFALNNNLLEIDYENWINGYKE